MKHIGIAAHPEKRQNELGKLPRCSPKGICIKAAFMSGVADSRSQSGTLLG